MEFVNGSLDQGQEKDGADLNNGPCSEEISEEERELLDLVVKIIVGIIMREKHGRGDRIYKEK